ncbi:MAG: hypothetical protein HDR53_00005 [Treponema sp.]|nr:hypothetical protein [Treponema sp.]MBD5409461.1 hypothetical protein [Treponema sp.]
MTQENLAEKAGTATNYIGRFKNSNKIGVAVFNASFFKTRLSTAIFA